MVSFRIVNLSPGGRGSYPPEKLTKGLQIVREAVLAGGITVEAADRVKISDIPQEVDPRGSFAADELKGGIHGGPILEGDMNVGENYRNVTLHG
jgi:hypothetical protein